MTAILEMTLEYKDPKSPPTPEVVMKAAKNMLAMVRGIDKEMHGKATIPWEISISCHRSRCVIGLDVPIKMGTNINEVVTRAATMKLAPLPGVKS